MPAPLTLAKPARVPRCQIFARITAEQANQLDKIADRLLIAEGRAGLIRLAIEYWLANSPDALTAQGIAPAP
jgi:hypothetical protein